MTVADPEAEDEGAMVLVELIGVVEGDASVVVPLDMSDEEELLATAEELLTVDEELLASDEELLLVAVEDKELLAEV